MKNTVFMATLASLGSIFCLSLKGQAQVYIPNTIMPDPILLNPIGNVAEPTQSDRQGFAMDSLYEQAADARREGNYSAAVQIYTKIINIDSQEAQAYFNRGSIRQSNFNDRAGAMADFQIALELFRRQGDNYMTRASRERIQELR
jgi:tetratricopeptide (TPR) repeat protein